MLTGTDLLPNGVWFGWVTDFGTDQVDFDLAYLWPGRLESAAGNDASLVRPVPVTPDTLIYSQRVSVLFRYVRTLELLVDSVQPPRVAK